MMADISHIIPPTLSLGGRIDQARREAAAVRLAAARNTSGISVTTNETTFVSSSSCSDSDDVVTPTANQGPLFDAVSKAPSRGEHSEVGIVAHQLRSLLSEKRRGFFQPLVEAIRDSKRDHLEGILLHLCIQFPDARAVAESLLTADDNAISQQLAVDNEQLSGSPLTADQDLSIAQAGGNRHFVPKKSNVAPDHKSSDAEPERAEEGLEKLWKASENLQNGAKSSSNITDQGVHTVGPEKRKRESSPDNRSESVPSKQKEPHFVIPKRSKIDGTTPARPHLEKSTVANKQDGRQRIGPALPDTGPYPRKTCRVCHKIFFDASTLNRHFKMAHGMEVGSLKCSKCEQRFSGQDAVHRHEQSVHGSKLEATKFARQEDDATNQSFENIANDSDTNTSAIKCPDCDNTFNRTGDLHRHQRNVHHVDQKPYKCSKCNNNFAKTEYLDQHMSASHLTGLFECVKCRRVFANADDLATHLSFQHGERIGPGGL